MTSHGKLEVKGNSTAVKPLWSEETKKLWVRAKPMSWDVISLYAYCYQGHGSARWTGCSWKGAEEVHAKKKGRKWNKKEDTRQPKYEKVTLRLFRVTTFAVEKHKYYIFWTCTCSLSNRACKAHATYYIFICGLSDPTIFFPTPSHKRHDFRKENYWT